MKVNVGALTLRRRRRGVAPEAADVTAVPAGTLVSEVTMGSKTSLAWDGRKWCDE
ncbi:hypothetical protein CSO01_27860 [Cellulomonas soli]|uniref:Uncharacterized protein n=1 Tax=Cellulomonas soli TaxID=931535 RepID=A0A512PFV1_9CELL|nr:hypothetical protein CSO01_27860 [Cellulomonas soli]